MHNTSQKLPIQYSEKELQLISLDPLVLFDLNGIILDVNEASVKSLGKAREDLIGSKAANYFTDPEKARRGIGLVFQDGKVNDYEVVIRIRDGARAIVSYNASVYKDKQGKIIGAYAAARDITDLKSSAAKLMREKNRVKKSLDKLIEMQKKLIRSERFAAIGEAAAYLSHEIKNSLMVIGGFANQVKKSISDDPDNCRKLKIIHDEIRRLEMLLTDVRDFTRPFEPKKELKDMNFAITNTLILLKDDLKKRGILCDTLLDNHLPLIYFDQSQIKQTLINLIKNAMEAVSDGGHLVISSLHEDGYIKISLVDNGPGMPPEVVKKIFDPFFTTKEKGTGLGLLVSRKIIEDHNGNISVQTKEGEGTTITMTLPFGMDKPLEKKSRK